MRFGIAGLVLCCLISCQPDLENPINEKLDDNRLEDIGVESFRVKVYVDSVSGDFSQSTFIYVTSGDSLYDSYFLDSVEYEIVLDVEPDGGCMSAADDAIVSCEPNWELKNRPPSYYIEEDTTDSECFNVTFTITKKDLSPIHSAEWWIQPESETSSKCRIISQD